MTSYRLTHAAQDDIRSILAWSHERFGEQARHSYEALLVAAIVDAATASGVGRTPRPELGAGVFSWHLALSRDRASGPRVQRPRHFLVCRQGDDVMVVGRVLHDSMDLRRHIGAEEGWE